MIHAILHVLHVIGNGAVREMQKQKEQKKKEDIKFRSHPNSHINVTIQNIYETYNEIRQ